MDLAQLNNLRVQLKRSWAAAGNPPPKVFVRCDEDENDIGEVGRTLASELGLRLICLNLAAGLDDEHRSALAKPGPRLVVIRNLGLSPPAELQAIIRQGPRSLILIEVRLPQKDFDRFNSPRQSAGSDTNKSEILGERHVA